MSPHDNAEILKRCPLCNEDARRKYIDRVRAEIAQDESKRNKYQRQLEAIRLQKAMEPR